MKKITQFAAAILTMSSVLLPAAEVINLTDKNLWIPVKNVEFSEGKMVNNGKTMFRSKNVIAIDPAKKYTFKMTMAAAGAEKSSLVLYGMMAAEAKGGAIASRYIQSIPGTFTQVAADAKAGDTVLKIKNGSKWSKSPSYGFVACNAKEDNSDIPNRNIVSIQIADIKHEGDIWVLTLKKPLTKALAANTNIRQHADGGYFYFGNRTLGKTQVTSTATVTGKTAHGLYAPSKGFHPAMTHAYIVILSDWYNAKNKIEIKDATLTIE